jgi:hypothetical protein
MKHQLEFFELFKDAKHFANLSEQGTGKTKTLIDIAGYKFEAGQIDAMFIAAPNEGDVPENWIDQIQLHLPPRIPRACVRYRGTGYMRVADRRLFETTLGMERDQALRVIATNIEAIRKGSPIFKYLLDWFRKARVFFIIDESTRIATPSAAQTKGALKLGMNATIKAISTGTMTAGGPFNAYSQCEFLSPEILDQPSFVAFKSQYCKMLPPEHGLVRHIIKKAARSGSHAEMLKSIIQLPERDREGRPIYKNLDDLHQRIAKVSYRKLKSECLDLPPKVYAPTRYVEFTSKQKEIYEQVRTEVIAEFVHDKRIVQMTIDMAMKRLLRLQQIIGNYYSADPDPDEPKRPPKRIEKSEDNPRLRVIDQIIEEADPEARGIIWCRFTAEIAEIVDYLEDKHGNNRVVEYHGIMSNSAQVASRKAFQDLNSPTRWLVGQIKSGIGVDMYAASWECFYSNDYSLENRLQAEDRAHRHGLKSKLTIFDIQTRNSIDSRIIATLRSKKEISEMILGDPPQNWI